MLQRNELPDYKLAESYIKLFSGFRMNLKTYRYKSTYLYPTTFQSTLEKLQIKEFIKKQSSEEYKALFRRMYADHIYPIKEEYIELSKPENKIRERKLRKIVFRLNSKSMFHRWLEQNQSYKTVLDLLLKQKVKFRWGAYDESLENLNIDGKEYKTWVLDNLLAKAYLLILKMEYRSILEKIAKSEFNHALEDRISDKSIRLAKRLRLQLIEDFDGIIPSFGLDQKLKQIISINTPSNYERFRFNDLKLELSQNTSSLLFHKKKEKRIPDKVQEKIIIREIALASHYYFEFTNSKTQRFPTRIMEEILNLFGIKMTARNIDIIMANYSSDKMKEARKKRYNNPDGSLYYMRPFLGV